MADVANEINNALSTFIGRKQTVTVFPAKVTSVDEAKLTCDAVDSEDIEHFDIRLRATVDGSDEGFVLIPEVGSWVLLANIGNSASEFAVIGTSAVTKVMCKVGQTVVGIENDGVLIERNAQSLKAMLDALIDQIKLITVTCAAPGSPSTPPLNLAAFDVIKTQVAQILK